MENIQTRCVIAGGGPAGMMLGYMLARAGVEVHVLEKWPDFFRDFRGDTIHPSSMEILHELGILEDFLKVPHNKTRRMIGRVGGGLYPLADFSRLHVREPYIAFLPQWDFLNFLAKEAAQYPSFHLHMETEATDIIWEHGRAVGVRAKHKEEQFDIRAELVIGCDGRHSTIREKAQLDMETLAVPFDVLWFKLAARGTDPEESFGIMNDGKVMVTLDRGDYWQCGWLIEKGKLDSMKQAGLPQFIADIKKLAPFIAPSADKLQSWDEVKLLSVGLDHAREWHKEGLLCIGDSAHTMSPMGGVGINVAIHDAVAAGNVLIRAFRRGIPTRDDLCEVQNRRERAVRKMQRVQSILQDRVLIPFLRKRGETHVPLPMRLLSWFPFLQAIPARFIGIGFGAQHIEKDLFTA
ncbi:MAG: FAD-dependent oxidoreductase [Candidatus Pacebacteria bacterium]|nr:FAD-dependent oxidoreductase [Candidatus Paceibacterota bacterium]